MFKTKKGFTLIELLVVIAIIGLLATLATVALNSARQKSRDARRVSDIKQIQTALELYYNDNGAYPTEAAAVTLGGTSAAVICDTSTTDGIQADTTNCSTIYMTKVPSDPGTESSYAYTYEISTGTTYEITFGLAGATGGLTCTSGYDATCCKASPSGIVCTY